MSGNRLPPEFVDYRPLALAQPVDVDIDLLARRAFSRRALRDQEAAVEDAVTAFGVLLAKALDLTIEAAKKKAPRKHGGNAKRP